MPGGPANTQAPCSLYLLSLSPVTWATCQPLPVPDMKTTARPVLCRALFDTGLRPTSCAWGSQWCSHDLTLPKAP